MLLITGQMISAEVMATKMKLLDLTLETAAENLALDEALLELAEESNGNCEVLRFWQPARPFVVVGRSSKVAAEVNQEECHRLGLPILRRSSGGASIVTGPGCLMYAVVLSYCLRPSLRAISTSHQFVLETLVNALLPYVSSVSCAGTSDLILESTGQKFSGNSVRCVRNHLLYHGTLLYDFPLELVSSCLRNPPRQPNYRRGRQHAEFVTNLKVDAAQLKKSIANAWDATVEFTCWPRQRTEELAGQKYRADAWNLRL